MLLPIQTTACLSTLVAYEILNVAVNGGCERWADVTEKEQDMAHFPAYKSAKFSLIGAPGTSMTVSVSEIAAGIQHLLTEAYPCAGPLKKKVLRIVANNDASEVDVEAASSILRAAMAVGAH
jgi:hypothetical protein